MDQIGHIIDQKGLKMYGKKQRNGGFGPKVPVFSGFFLNEIRRSPPKRKIILPKKPLAKRGDTPPPLTERLG